MPISYLLAGLSCLLFTLWTNGMPPYNSKVTFSGLTIYAIPIFGKVQTEIGQSYMFLIFPVSNFSHFFKMLQKYFLIGVAWVVTIIMAVQIGLSVFNSIQQWQD